MKTAKYAKSIKPMRFGSYLSIELTNIPPCPTKTTVKTQIWANACIGVESENRAGNIRHNSICACGEIGKRLRFRFSCLSGVQVQVLSGAPNMQI